MFEDTISGFIQGTMRKNVEERTYEAKKKKMAEAAWSWDWLGLDANPNFLSY